MPLIPPPIRAAVVAGVDGLVGLVVIVHVRAVAPQRVILADAAATLAAHDVRVANGQIGFAHFMPAANSSASMRVLHCVSFSLNSTSVRLRSKLLPMVCSCP